MRKEYDFSDSKKNPYAKKLKKPISIRLDEDTIEYFKSLADETSLPFSSLCKSSVLPGCNNILMGR